jgi:phosphate-selective porin OprO and OprP
MLRLTSVAAASISVLASPLIAGQSPATTRGDSLARLERLEATVADQAQRLAELQERADDIATRRPSAGYVAETRKILAELMTDAEFRDSLYPSALTAGFDPGRGFYIDSADRAFSFNLKGYTQIRYTGINRQTDNPTLQGRQKRDDISAFEIERLYLTFFGHIHTPKLKYRIVVDGGYTATGREDGLWRTYFAHVDYEYLKGHHLTVGLFRLPFGAVNMTSSTMTQFTERSLAAWAHWVDRSVGVMAHGDLLGRRLTYFASVTNGVFNPEDSPSAESLDTNFAYTARLAYYVLGKGDSLYELYSGYAQSDLAFSKDPTLRLGGGLLFNDNNGDLGTGGVPGLWAAVPDRVRRGRGIGGTQVVDDLGTEYCFLSFDAGFKRRGLSINAEYFLRIIDGEDEQSQWEMRTGKGGTSHQQAGHLQVGYFILPKKVEVAGRIGGIWDNDGDDAWEWGVAVNYFPWSSYSCMLSADFIRISEVAGGVASGPNYSLNDEISMIRVLLQVGF